MSITKNYIKEIQKFTTSHYWNSGVRITTGVMIPMLIMANKGWLSDGIPFLWGALFVSLTDTPGPIHHRRNGMIAGILLNTCAVVLTGMVHQHQTLLIIGVLVLSFFFSMLGIYGTRAGAVGTLAIVVMLLNMSPFRENEHYIFNAALTAAGGAWYATFSMLLFRLQPYRLVEQALGENLLQIADYMRARGTFYRPGADIDSSFNRVMQGQVEVLKNQSQLRELIFRTRQFVSDASPKSRKIMMVFLESLDLFEETMYIYQDYKLLQQHTRHTDILKRFYGVILDVANELERIGLSVQAGVTVKSARNFNDELSELSRSLEEQKVNSTGVGVGETLHALELTIENIQGIVSRLSNLVTYTQLHLDINPTVQDHDGQDVRESSRLEASKPIHVSLLFQNLTLRSNNFRYSCRLTLAMIMGYGIAAFFALSHIYWVLLTIVTILKPVYNVTRKRNIQRVVGTLGGIVAASIILLLISNNTILFVLMIVCMLMAYSFLRTNYLGFVIFLTVYIIITFHFLNPVEFTHLIGERLVDTFVGSVVAAIAARFIFPVWKHENIIHAMQEMLLANRAYLLAALNYQTGKVSDVEEYNAARNDAIVALTNLSDNFQQMLVEPGQAKESSHIHQFVIASHALTSRISALSSKQLENIPDDKISKSQESILQLLNDSIDTLQTHASRSGSNVQLQIKGPNTLTIINSLAHEIYMIVQKMIIAKE